MLPVYRGLRNNEVVMVQAGHVSLPHRGEPQVAPDMNERYLVNMGTEFLVRVLEYADGRHSEVYAIRPEISRQRYPLHPHLRDDRSALLGGRCLQALCTDFAPDKACSSLVDVLDFAAIWRNISSGLGPGTMLIAFGGGCFSYPRPASHLPISPRYTEVPNTISTLRAY